MAIKFNEIGKLVKNAERLFSSDSSARKFSTNDSVENNNTDRNVKTTSNLDHLINQAAGLKSMGHIVQQAAENAKRSLDTARRQTQKVAETKGDSRSPTRAFSDTDVKFEQDKFIGSIVDKGIPGFSETVSQAIAQVANTISSTGNKSFLTTIQRGDAESVLNNSIPRIDHIVVDMDKKKGSVDAFFASIKYSLPLAAIASKSIKCVKIFRSSVTDPSLMRRVNVLSFHGLERLRSESNRSRAKNQDFSSTLEKRLAENGVVASLSSLNPFDPETGKRVASSQEGKSLAPSNSSAKQLGRSSVFSDLSSFINTPADFIKMDRSVSQDLNTLRNLRLQDPSLAPEVGQSSTEVAGKNIIFDSRLGHEQIRQTREQHDGSDLIVSKNNQQDFQEIANFFPEVPAKDSKVGDFAEYTFEDGSIMYGRIYRYFIMTVDKDMREGVRSKITQVVVDGLRVPARPQNVTTNIINKFVAMTISVEDQLVEKFEIYRREINSSLAVAQSFNVSLVAGTSGFTSEKEVRSRSKNGFMQIGEALNGPKNVGATFYDQTALNGLGYTYRVYAVDIFGNKSESPYEFNFFVPDPLHKQTDLVKPTILAEVDTFGKNIRLTFRCEDKRVKRLLLTRRDLTLFQKAFAVPHEVSHIRMGSSDGAQGQIRFEDVHLSDRNRVAAWVGWNGVFESDGTDITFIDQATRIDHTYDYQLYGMDVFGNKTPFEFSHPIFIFNRPLINSPVSFSGKIEVNADFNIIGAKITWKDSNINFSSEEIMGNQDTLASTSVRSLFQLQRRRIGDERWLDFPMLSEKEFLDPIESSGSVAPSFRPPFLKLGETYLYRIQSFQTGNFISNFTLPLEIFVDHPVTIPDNFRLRTANPGVRPFYVMLEWNTQSISGIVDKWQIERATVNNFAADRLNSRNPSDFANVPFESYREVFRESSRFQSRTLDQQGLKNPFDTDHGFMDMQVHFGNTYFYRIRAVGIDNTVSEWTYRGMKVTDETFQQKMSSLVSVKEIEKYVKSFSPFRLKGDFLEPAHFDKIRSFGILPKFSNPSNIANPKPSDLAPLKTFDEQVKKSVSVANSLVANIFQFLKKRS